VDPDVLVDLDPDVDLDPEDGKKDQEKKSCMFWRLEASPRALKSFKKVYEEIY
jgi:hypothetical protein